MARSNTSFKPGKSGWPGGLPREWAAERDDLLQYYGHAPRWAVDRSLGRTHRLTVYFTEDEAARIRQAAKVAGVDILSDFLRQCTLQACNSGGKR